MKSITLIKNFIVYDESNQKNYFNPVLWIKENRLNQSKKDVKNQAQEIIF